MDLSFSDEQELLRESVRGVVEREAPLARVREWVLEDGVDHEPAAELAARQGWTGIGIDEDAGGQGGGMLELAIVAEELGRGAVPADALYASLLAALALERCGADGMADRIAAIAAGEACAALARPGGAPLDAKTGVGPVALVPGAGQASFVLAWQGDALALHRPEDFTVSPRRMVDRTRSVADVELGGGAQPAGRLHADAMADLAARAAVLVAADALGAMQRMLDLTVQYTGERVQFGVPVGSFQAVKHSAAQMLVAIEGTRAAVHYAAWAVGAGEPGCEVDAWVAKATASRAAMQVSDAALFLHGAVGYTWEHDLQLPFKRARSDAELFGGAGAYDDRIADALHLVRT